MTIPEDWVKAIPGILTAAIVGAWAWFRSRDQDSATVEETEARIEDIRLRGALSLSERQELYAKTLQEQNDRLSSRLDAMAVRLDGIVKEHEAAMQIKDGRIKELEGQVHELTMNGLNMQAELADERARVAVLTRQVGALLALMRKHGIDPDSAL